MRMADKELPRLCTAVRGDAGSSLHRRKAGGICSTWGLLGLRRLGLHPSLIALTKGERTMLAEMLCEETGKATTKVWEWR